MVGNFSTWVALRYLRSKRKEVFISIISIISILGVAISVMVLDIVLAVMTGFETELPAKLVSVNPHVTVRRYGGNIRAWEELVQRIKGVPDVVAAYPYTYGQAMLSTGEGATGILLRGVLDAGDARAKLTKTLISPGDIDRLFMPAEVEVLRPDGTYDNVMLPPIIIGRALASRQGLAPGHVLTLVSPELSSSPHGLIPKVRRFVVAGTYSSGLMEYELHLAYLSMKDAQTFFGLGDGVDGIEVEVDDWFKAKEIAKRIISALSSEDAVYYATDWSTENAPLWEALRLEKTVYFIVLLLLILLASFSIVSTLVMIVLEKTKDIAILKSMGATDKSILKIFLTQGAVVGVFGTIIGTLLGFLGSFGLKQYRFPLDESVFSLKYLPVHLVPTNFLLVAVSSLVITSLAGIYPARRAARLNPAEALRFE